MTKTALMQKTIEKISLLPEKQIIEINQFAEFLLAQLQNKILTKEVSHTNLNSNSFKFLEQEEDIYTVNDLKEKYH